MTFRVPDLSVSPAEFIAAFDAAAPDYIRPWFMFASTSLAQHGLTWNAVAVALQLQIEARELAKGDQASLVRSQLSGGAHAQA